LRDPGPEHGRERGVLAGLQARRLLQRLVRDGSGRAGRQHGNRAPRPLRLGGVERRVLSGHDVVLFGVHSNTDLFVSRFHGDAQRRASVLRLKFNEP